MGFFDAVNAQFLPSPVRSDGLSTDSAHLSPSQTITEGEKKEKADTQENAVEPSIVESGPEAAGVAKIEATQAVWSSRGKYVLFARYVIHVHVGISIIPGRN